MDDFWDDDRLGYRSVAEAFTRLVQTIDDTKVISVEAGYGRGKTFFRERWARHLEAAGETVVQVDAHLSDHSGDPVLTFIGALIDKLPASDTPGRDAAFEKGKKVLGVLARTGGGILARQGAGALVDYLSGELAEEFEGNESLSKHIDAIGEAVSKKAGGLIAAQIEAERIRTTELPQQLDALREALTQEQGKGRVIVLVDELDRCHPDYAIAFLEAMKLVFNRNGFVFCLMVNADYLEGLAAHRFGKPEAGERYLDKFLDIRLALPFEEQTLRAATEQLFMTLPAGEPFGEGPEFTLQRAAKLAGDLSVHTGMSFRQIERVKLRVDLALRGNVERPLDFALLVALAFRDAASPNVPSIMAFLPRSKLTRWASDDFKERLSEEAQFDEFPRATKFIAENCRELLNLPRDRYALPDAQAYYDWAKVCLFLGQHYVPDHEAALNAFRRFEVQKR